MGKRGHTCSADGHRRERTDDVSGLDSGLGATDSDGYRCSTLGDGDCAEDCGGHHSGTLDRNTGSECMSHDGREMSSGCKRKKERAREPDIYTIPFWLSCVPKFSSLARRCRTLDRPERQISALAWQMGIYDWLER